MSFHKGRVVQWDERFAIGIDVIDHQHRMLLDYFTLLNDAIASGGRWSDVHFPMLQLREYAQHHFSVEEALLRMSDYPTTEVHIESHRTILQNLENLERSSLQKNLRPEDADFLRDWLLGHTLKADRDFALHFATGGRIVVRKAQSG